MRSICFYSAIRQKIWKSLLNFNQNLITFAIPFIYTWTSAVCPWKLMSNPHAFFKWKFESQDWIRNRKKSSCKQEEKKHCPGAQKTSQTPKRCYLKILSILKIWLFWSFKLDFWILTYFTQNKLILTSFQIQ